MFGAIPPAFVAVGELAMSAAPVVGDIVATVATAVGASWLTYTVGSIANDGIVAAIDWTTRQFKNSQEQAEQPTIASDEVLLKAVKEIEMLSARTSANETAIEALKASNKSIETKLDTIIASLATKPTQPAPVAASPSPSPEAPKPLAA
jgi:hypothetical protein